MSERVPLLLDRIRAAILRDPAAPAFLGGGPEISYGSMRALIANMIELLAGRGVRTGQVVALTMSQSPLHVITFLALARMGAVSMSVNPIAREADRVALYRRFGVTAVVSEREDAGSPGVALILVKGIGARGDEAGLDSWEYEPVGATPMRIALTSGTVGEQKGIEQTHEAFARRMDRRFYGDTARPRVMPPNLHVTASLTLACHALATGGAVVFPPGYDAVNFLTTVARMAVTHVTLPPSHLALMLPAVRGDAPAFPGVTHLRLLGATPAPAFLDLVRRKFTPNIFVPYSTIETGVISIATPQILAQAPESSGRVAPDSQLEVIGQDGRVAAPNTVGEIRVRVPGMATGYLGGVDAGRFRDGWFHPRDSGYVSHDGLVFVKGRMDEIINVGGRKLSPRHAEAILEEHPGVAEAAVFELDAADRAARLAALIVPLGRPIDWEALAKFARGRLEILAPESYFEIERLPRNALGKLQRDELRELAAGASLRYPAK